MDWKTAEKRAQESYEKEGYVVLNPNDVGFPDLIVVKDGKIAFFVEVKAMQKPDIKERGQMWYHQYLRSLNFEVKCINFLDKKVEFQPDSEWSDAIKKDNPWLPDEVKS